jgi:hypothetical protein
VSASKAKGTKWETEIVRALRDAGFVQAERRAGNGIHDRGDITGIPGLVVEAKNHARTELAEWVKEAITERDNARAMYGVVWHKRRGKAAAEDGYVTMTGGDFLWLLADALGIDREVS